MNKKRITISEAIKESKESIKKYKEKWAKFQDEYYERCGDAGIFYEDPVCGFMGCENTSDEWYHITVHNCVIGETNTTCCPECIKKIFVDDDD